MENLWLINENRNDRLSYLRGLDLQELIIQIENFNFEYRQCLNLPNEVTFGLEIEHEGIFRDKTNQFIKENIENWKLAYDLSLDDGGEIVSPILHDEIKTWQDLKKICEYLKVNNAITDNKASGHIHIGAHTLNSDLMKWRKFLKAYTVYESVLFRFGYGDKLNGRRGISKFSKPIEHLLYSNMEVFNQADNIEQIVEKLPHGKKKAINFGNFSYWYLTEAKERNTIEFRSPNATDEEVIWQNNINTFSKLIYNCSNFDEEFLDFKLEHERINSLVNYYRYEKLSLKNSLEFADLIFDNNLDKAYFLKQYFKNFDENYSSEMIKIKKL